VGDNNWFVNRGIIIDCNAWRGGVITFANGTRGVIKAPSNGGAGEKAYIYYNAGDNVVVGKYYCNPPESETGCGWCTKCSYKCATCITSYTNCVTCSGANRGPAPGCECLTGYYDDKINADCTPKICPVRCGDGGCYDETSCNTNCKPGFIFEK